MSDKRSLRFLLVLLFAACSSAALVLAGAGASGQNSNTSEESMQGTNANANTNAPRRGRGRRGRQRPAASADDTAQPTAELSVAAPTAQDDDSRGDLSGEQVDLSGTYEGRVTMTGGHEMSGAATLTITGNSFTLTGEGMTHTGRIYSVLTRGATSAALYFTDVQDPTTSTPLAANVRARKRGDTLTLTPAPNAKNRLTFTQARGRR